MCTRAVSVPVQCHYLMTGATGMWVCTTTLLFADYAVAAYPATVLRTHPFTLGVSLLCSLALMGTLIIWVSFQWYKHTHVMSTKYWHMILCVVCGVVCMGSAFLGVQVSSRASITPSQSEQLLLDQLLTDSLPKPTEAAALASNYEAFLLSLVYINRWSPYQIYLLFSALYFGLYSIVTYLAQDNTTMVLVSTRPLSTSTDSCLCPEPVESTSID